MMLNDVNKDSMNPNKTTSHGFMNEAYDFRT